jgi:hypothetical protein
MLKKVLFLPLAIVCSLVSFPQAKLSVDNVYAAYLRNSGTIMNNNEITGYFFLYQSDKIDRSTNEYTLQILDQNLNKVIDIKFQDSKKLSLLESAYNGSTLAFLFKNEDTKTLDMKIYGIDGKLRFTYSREYDNRTEELMKMYETMHTDEGMNQNVFNIGDRGYVSILPIREGSHRTYQIDFFGSEQKKQWSYSPTDEEKYANAEYLGNTDSIVIIEVMKKNHATSNKVTAQLVGINFITRKKAFEIDREADQFKIVPSSISYLKEQGKIMVMGNYFQQDANIIKDHSEGLAIYEIDSKGKTISKTYNSWTEDFAKYLPVNAKGKIDNLGYLYIHKMMKMPDGRLFIVGEGYKRQASAGGIALNALSMAAGGYAGMGNTKIVITDMVMMEFNDKYKIVNASIFDKTNNTALASQVSDFNSQHAIAVYLKMIGAFDYEFTMSDPDNSNFSVCFSDWVRTSEYKGQTFNTIRYNGEKFVTDKIELKSKASSMKVFPAKTGSVLILEYFKKAKKLEFRLERIG